VVKFFKHGIRHLPVRDGDEIIGILSVNGVVQFASKIPFYFLDEIRNAEDLDDLKAVYSKLNEYVVEFISRDEYINPIDIGKVLTYLNDEIIKRVIKLLKFENPCRFSLFVMGSEGRLEQLIKTDQDNAMIFEKEMYRDVFIDFGEEVHKSLLKIGFPDCEGGYTVGNPKWVRSLEDWIETVETWKTYHAENLLNVSIFTDMRFVCGDVSLFNLVQNRLFKLSENRIFVVKLIEDSLRFRVPIRFGRISTDVLDVKKHGISPIVIPVRALSFAFGIKAKNTVERIKALARKNVISLEMSKELIASYSFLKRLQLIHQVENMKTGRPINEIDLKDLPKVKIDFIKSALKTISSFHKAVEMRFL
jgi:CBS domain-containing protein